MLTLRKRGRYWHARGTVRVGSEVRQIKEHSSGCRERASAQSYVVRLEKRIQDELLYGNSGQTDRVSFADVGQVYIERPGGVPRMDIWRIGELNDILGDHTVNEILSVWPKFIRVRCTGLAPATVDRFRATLQAALNHAAGELGYDPPRIPPIKFDNTRNRWLTEVDADRLVSCYSGHVQPIIWTLRLQGCRTQEALQLHWKHVDLERRTLYFERTKNGEQRMVPMARRVELEIRAIHERRGQPVDGHVFLNSSGKPYADTRDYKYPGGNPLRSAHATALKHADVSPIGGPDFRPHDWRHHWASWCVMKGIDLPTIQRLGGWKTLRMLERYAAVGDEHMREQIRKLG